MHQAIHASTNACCMSFTDKLNHVALFQIEHKIAENNIVLGPPFPAIKRIIPCNRDRDHGR